MRRLSGNFSPRPGYRRQRVLRGHQKRQHQHHKNQRAQEAIHVATKNQGGTGAHQPYNGGGKGKGASDGLTDVGHPTIKRQPTTGRARGKRGLGEQQYQQQGKKNRQ